ncbi:hypothetical protein ACVGWN_21160, partial [Enterobacter hormaechei]
CRPGKRSATGQKRAERAEGRPPPPTPPARVKKKKKTTNLALFSFILVKSPAVGMPPKNPQKQTLQKTHQNYIIKKSHPTTHYKINCFG